MIFSVLLAFLAWYIAYRLYQSGFEIAYSLRKKWEWAYKISLNKWYVDELYNFLLIKPVHLLTNHFLWRFFDLNVLDRIVNSSGTAVRTSGNTIRPLQNGLTQNYAIIFTFGTFLILLYLI